VIGRSIKMSKNETPTKAVQRYLREARTKSASLLAELPVIVVWPRKYCGRVIWMRAILSTAGTKHPNPHCSRSRRGIEERVYLEWS